MLYASTTVRAYASLDHIHAVAVDGHARLSNVDAGLLSRVVWAGPDIFLNFSAGDTDSGYNLRAVDLTDGTQRSLCAGGFYSFAVDREMGLVAANCQIGLSSTDLSGLYLFDLKTSRQTKVSDDVGLVEAWGLGNGRFRVRGLEGGDEILAAAGSRTPWPWGEGAAVPAPGGSYFVVITQQAMQVYDAAGEWVRTIELLGGNGQDAVRWRPDDLGLFYQRGPQLYAVDTLTGEPRLVDSLPEGAEAYGMQWVAR